MLWLGSRQSSTGTEAEKVRRRQNWSSMTMTLSKSLLVWSLWIELGLARRYYRVNCISKNRMVGPDDRLAFD